MKVRATSKASTAKAEPIIKITPQIRWNRSNRQARVAHSAVRTALRNGTLKRRPCEVCGSYRVDFHHPFHDYTDPLRGVFLCRLHHKEAEAAERGVRAAA